jgi:putative spermidine/putrescine transport system ATP-binding protein
MSRLELANVTKRFGTSPTSAVDGVSLNVEDGELVCLLGPSGSGKSTVLRMIGGFETPTAGAIMIDGEDVTAVPPEKRPTGMVFQSHALWSHMNVFGNIAFGLKLRHLPRAEIARRVEAVLELVGLGGFGTRLPHQLSGGQQQRVALARSLVLEPKILLLDEPFASLDQHLRERLREEVRDIQQRVGITTLFVTHGQDEALALADRIVVMRDGRIEQADRPEMIYRDPRTPFVAGFIGQMNLVPSTIAGGHLAFAGSDLAISLPDGPALLAVRPEFLQISRSEFKSDPVAHRVIDYGTHLMVDVELTGGERLKAMAAPADGWRAGMNLRLWPRQFAVYRNDVVVHRASLENPSSTPAAEPATRAKAYV